MIKRKIVKSKGVVIEGGERERNSRYESERGLNKDITDIRKDL